MPDTPVCFHGRASCAYCGRATVAPWRTAASKILAVLRCPVCGRKSLRQCGRCRAAGFEALTLFDLEV